MASTEVERSGRRQSVRVTRASLAELDGEQRMRRLAAVAYNPLELAAEHVELDLKTDSWAQLSLPAIAQRRRALFSRLQRALDVGAAVREIFPFPHLVLTDSGRSAEHLFYKAFPSKGAVLQNLLFPSTLYHQIDKGFDPVELPDPRAFELQSAERFRGGLAWESLRERVSSAKPSVLVCLELSCNAAGGLPVSMRDLAQVKALLTVHAIPLAIDATRVVENARLVIEHEAGFAGRDTWSVVRELLSHADIVVGSLSKDFGVIRGGIIATRDAGLMARVREAMIEDGRGLDAVDARLAACALLERGWIEAQVVARMQRVRELCSALDSCGAPIVTPAGAHCALIDVKQIGALRGFESPVAAFLAWLYRETGIRGGAHSAGMQRNSALNDLVRLAVPIGMKSDEVAQISERLARAFARAGDYPQLVRDPASRQSFGELQARYVLEPEASRGSEGTQEMSAEPAAAVSVSTEESSMSVMTRASGDTPPARARAASEQQKTPDADAGGARGPLDIAVIGMAGRYPEARNVRELWRNLAQGRDSIVELPAERYERRLRHGPAQKYRGGFIEDIDKFDPLFFNIAPKDAENADPQLRLFLEVAWETLEDAGYYPESLPRRDVGVFVGAVWAMYQMLGVEEKHLGFEKTPNSFLWSIANRVSYWMNLSGPSMTLDTACSSSLTALYLACEAIVAGDCSAALVGGVNLDLHQSKWDINSAGGALSKDGVCRSFGRGANGYVAGEGIGAILIKPLDLALADGDHVYGVIKSVTVNHGGRTSGYMVPNPKAQAQLVRAALERARVDARTIGYIEAHGTGTELGDPLEIAGLRTAFEKDAVPKQTCSVGSIKTNIGHLEAAAGVVGITKVLLQMQHRKLVPSLHSRELNEFIEFADSPFFVQQQLADWEPKSVEDVRYPLRAGISSFGAGGANAHAVLEAYEAPAPVHEAGGTRELVFPLSARNEEQLRQAAERLRDHVIAGDLWERGSEAQWLRDAAHTLQIGRKPFDFRLAIVAKSAAELSGRLGDFLAGCEDDGIFTGSVKNAEPVTRLLSRKERAELLELLARRREPAGLARLWVNGVIPDWRALHDGSAGRRISLPTYPFADKRYWACDEGAGSPGVRGAQAAIHPLLDANESTFDRQLFRKRFDERDFFIYDHVVGEVPTLPGVAYLELARKAGELAAGRAVRKIRNVLWVKPIMVESGAAVDTRIELEPRGEAVQFEVFSMSAAGERIPHSQGSLTFATRKDTDAPAQYLDVEAVRSRCERVLEGREVYPLFESVGLSLGPSFQVLKEVYRNEQEILGVLELPQSRRADLEHLLLHPSLVDGALQAGVAAGLRARTGEMLVPFSISEVEILNSLATARFSYVTDAKEGAKEGSRVSKRNVLILDEAGKVLVRIKESTGVPLSDVVKKNAGAERRDGASRLYYSHAWEPAALAAVESAVLPAILFLDTDEQLRDLYRERLAKAGSTASRAVLARPGTSFRETGDATYEIDPREPADFVRLIETVSQRHGIDQVCFCWPLRSTSGVDYLTRPEAFDNGVLAALFLCQALIRFKLENSAQLLYVFTGDADGAWPQDEAINGLFKTLRLEHGKVQSRAVDLAQTYVGAERCLEVLLAEYRARADDAPAVCYRDEQRFVRKLVRETPAASGQPARSLIKEDGTYFITGGAGGLGLIFAEFIARQTHARLVLTGRTAPSPQLESKLDRLREHGSQVLYLCADVADRDALHAALDQARKHFGPINGVIHSAGVLRDSYIRNKTREEMQAVLAPKVLGTVHLDEATRDDPLDFFVLFSSLAAVAGNAGQGDYAFANHFMDSYAARRERLRARGERRGRALSINWSLWADGGMNVDAQTEQLLTKTLGVRLLSIASGLEAFTTALASDKAQLAVIEGDREKIEALWGLNKKRPTEPAAPLPAAEEATARDATANAGAQDLLEVVRAELSGLVMKLLKLEASETSADSILLDLGFDSIGLTTFANEINSKYEADVTPVLFFDYPSIEEIAKYLCKERRDAVARVHRTSPAAAPQSVTAPVAAPLHGEAAESSVVTLGKRWSPPRDDGEGAGASPPAALSVAQRFVDQPIAIVGMSGMLPQSENVEEFWDHLAAARNLVTVIPPERWSWEEYYGDPFKEANKSSSKWGGFMKEVDKFDPLFFGISRREAVMMDPQQRLFLEAVWRAIEDSGHKVADFSGTRTGLFVGVATNEYSDVLIRSKAALDGYTASGNSHAVLANRVSFLLNLRGPSAPIDTACSSSLIALHRAIESIHTGSCDMAIVGGVQVMLSPAAFISFSRAGMLSGDGRCKTFDKRADGYVRGEGVGAIVLKPLAAAQADGDHIYAVVRGTAENHGGRVTTLTAPNSAAQAELLIEAYEKAQLDPSTVGYIECHGTGTSLGDPIEVQALTKAFGELYRRAGHAPAQVPHCALSSVKTNIGHLETAAGIAAVIKVLLALRHRRIPANLHFEELNPYINLKGTPFYVAGETVPWQAPCAADGSELPRRAGVSSFGFGGANAHVVLEEYVPQGLDHEYSTAPVGPQLIVLSAKSEDRLVDYARSLIERLERDDPDLVDVAYTLQVGRDEMAQRLAILATSVTDLKATLRRFVHGERDLQQVYRGEVKSRTESRATSASSQEDASTAIEQDALAQVAQRWVAGATIAWQTLPRPRTPRRIPLPTYPFARERCWIAESVQGGLRSASAEPAPARIEPVENAMPGARPAPESEPQSTIAFYRSTWRESALIERAAARPRVVLLFAHSEASRESLAQHFADTGSHDVRIAWVKAGAVFAEHDTLVFEIDPSNEAHYSDLARALLARDAWPDAVIHGWAAADFSPEEAELRSSLDKGAQSFIYASRALMQVAEQERERFTPASGRTQLIYVYQSALDHPQPQHAAVAAFAKCCGLESGRFAGKCIEVQSEAAPAVLAQWLADEMQEETPTAGLVRYRDGRRSVQGVERFEPTRAFEAPLKQRGSYLITGGAGGLGMLFARHLAERVRARLVLTGRSPLNAAQETKLASLRALGAEVEYIQADVTRRADVDRLLGKIRARFGVLDGIIHAAGVLQYAPLHSKTAQQIEAVLAPKVLGAVHLDEATRSEALDFFVVFSSISAITGTAGLSDYAYANCFLDHFVERRNLLAARGARTGRAIAIDWPLWQAGGMTVDASIAAFIKKSAGIDLLDTPGGLAAFTEVLADGHSQVLVVKGEIERIGEYLRGGGQRAAKRNAPRSPVSAQQARTPGTENGASGRDLDMRLQSDLLRLVARIALLEEGEISADTNLGDYGMDSINLAELVRTINERYGLTLRAATFFEHPTLNALATFLLREHREQVLFCLGGSSAPHVEATVQPAPAPPGARIEPSRPPRIASSRSDVAIVGVYGRYPQCEGLQELWEHLLAGSDLVSEVPAERWDWRRYAGDPLEQKNTTNSRWGGFLKDIDKFDAAFFGIGAAEARLMDPQQRLFLEVAWKAIEDAGERPSALAGTRTGVYVGMSGSEYAEVLRTAHVDVVGHAATGLATCVLPNRLSYLLDLRGPSEPVDTACSSSLVALHRAVEAIGSGACDMAIAGGVNVLLNPELYLALGNSGVLASDGRCKTFDRRADGYVRGEGCVAVFLKPLERALADGNPIHAVVKGSGVGHGGRAMSLTAPNPNAQAELLIDVYERAGVDPRTVSYVEVHGTGTALGDAVEINALRKAFGELTARAEPASEPVGENRIGSCGLGSLKPNIGHLEAASGLAGLTKVLLALRHGVLPGTAHLEELSPHIDLEGSAFHVVKTAREWEPLRDASGRPLPRSAGISAFGFGGVNAHVIVQEYVEDSRRASVADVRLPSGRYAIPLSARSIRSLDQLTRDLLEYLRARESITPETLTRIAYTLQTGRDAREERLGVLAESAEDLIEKLEACVAGEYEFPGIYRRKAMRDADGIGPINRDAEIRDTIVERWIERGDLGSVLEMWVKGLEVDWSKLYGEAKPLRLSLPTYPFERVRHWVGAADENAMEVPERGEPNRTETHTGSRQMMGSTARSPAEQVEHVLVRTAAAMLGRPAGELSRERSFIELGLRSLEITELVRAINQALDVNLSPSLLFQYPSIDELATFLAQTYPDEIRSLAAHVPRAEVQPSVRIDGMLESLRWSAAASDADYETTTF